MTLTNHPELNRPAKYLLRASVLLLSLNLGCQFSLPITTPQPNRPLTSPLACQTIQLRLSQPALRTRALTANLALPQCENVRAVSLSVSGVGIETPIQLPGADADGRLVVTEACELSLTLPDVPAGQGRILQFAAYDADGNPIGANTYAAVFNLEVGDQTVTLDCLSTAVADVYTALLNLDPAIAGHLDLTALRDFTAEVLGYQDGSVAVLPAQLVAETLARDLVAAEGDFSKLQTDNPAYVNTSGLIRFGLSGLAGSDRITAELDDPAQTRFEGLGNGEQSLQNVPPGTWQLRFSADAGNGTSYQLPPVQSVTVPEAGELVLADLTVSAALPRLNPLPAEALRVGEILTITGENFHASLAGNQVLLDQQAVELLSASSTELSLRVPRRPGPRQLSVIVGTSASEPQAVEISRLKWELAIDNLLHATPAILADGGLYLLSTSGKIQRIGVDGVTMWTFETGAAFYSSPVLGASGRIYAVSSAGEIFALEADGRLAWRRPLEVNGYGGLALDGAENLYYLTGGNALVSLAPDGSERWRYQGQTPGYNPFRQGPTPIVGPDGTVYFGSLDGHVYALDPQGGLNWRYSAGSRIFASPTLDRSGKLYIALFEGGVKALRADSGDVIWSFGYPVNLTSGMVLDGRGHLLLGTWDTKLMALDLNGNFIWSKRLDGNVDNPPLVDAEGRSYVGTAASQMWVVNQDSQIEWSFKLPNDSAVGVTMGPDGIVYIASNSPGRLYALYSDSTALANSDWPKAYRDLGNTSYLP